MSSLANVGQLRRATSQLPVSWYCDPAVFDAEQRLLFPRAPGYVGHELMVPNPGDYHALAWRDNAQALVRNPQGIELVSNICRHRQAIMLKGRGNVPNIVCPIHRWTYDLKGELLGAPHFAEEDGRRFLRESTSDGIEFRLKAYSNLICQRPIDNVLVDFDGV